MSVTLELTKSSLTLEHSSNVSRGEWSDARNLKQGPRMKSIYKIAASLLLLSLNVGCATQGSGIDALWQQEIRERALACYNHHADHRYVIGSGPTWAACKRWATANHRQTINSVPSP